MKKSYDSKFKSRVALEALRYAPSEPHGEEEEGFF